MRTPAEPGIRIGAGSDELAHADLEKDWEGCRVAPPTISTALAAVRSD
jgi:hypothetical protein